MDHIRELELRLAALERRVVALETKNEAGKPVAGATKQVQEIAQEYVAETSQTGWHGEVLYRGRMAQADGKVTWEMARPVEGLLPLLDKAPDQIVRVLTALAHPLRLALLRLLLDGPQSSQKLQEALGVSSPGQLYHHLRELQATGIIEQHGRSSYTLPVRHYIPVLAMLAIVYDLASMDKK